MTILTIENLNPIQSLSPDNWLWHLTAFAILAISRWQKQKYLFLISYNNAAAASEDGCGASLCILSLKRMLIIWFSVASSFASILLASQLSSYYYCHHHCHSHFGYNHNHHHHHHLLKSHTSRPSWALAKTRHVGIFWDRDRDNTNNPIMILVFDAIDTSQHMILIVQSGLSILSAFKAPWCYIHLWHISFLEYWI